MKTYRWSVRLKLGLIVGAGIIAVASLLYTQRLVDRLREREQALIQLWADAQAELVQAQQQAINPHLGTLQELEGYLQRLEENPQAGPPSEAVLDQYQTAVAWAQGMPPTSEANFILNKIIQPNQFRIPAIITDSSGRHPRFWRNVGVPDTLSAPRLDSAAALKQLRARKREMATTFEPIPIRVDLPTTKNPALLETESQFTQYLYYDESWLIQELRIFPWVQLLFVGLFIMVGYFGFSYIRRSEQSSLWMGMAREAAHQLGTPRRHRVAAEAGAAEPGADHPADRHLYSPPAAASRTGRGVDRRCPLVPGGERERGALRVGAGEFAQECPRRD